MTIKESALVLCLLIVIVAAIVSYLYSQRNEYASMPLAIPQASHPSTRSTSNLTSSSKGSSVEGFDDVNRLEDAGWKISGLNENRVCGNARFGFEINCPDMYPVSSALPGEHGDMTSSLGIDIPASAFGAAVQGTNFVGADIAVGVYRDPTEIADCEKGGSPKMINGTLFYETDTFLGSGAGSSWEELDDTVLRDNLCYAIETRITSWNFIPRVDNVKEYTIEELMPKLRQIIYSVKLVND